MNAKKAKRLRKESSMIGANRSVYEQDKIYKKAKKIYKTLTVNDKIR